MNNNDYRSKTLKALISFWIKNKRHPAVRELMDMTGIPSSSHQHSILNDLVASGSVRKSGHAYIPHTVWDKLSELS